jgi:hypothetical protein
LPNLPQTNSEIRQWYLDQLSQIAELNEQWAKNGVLLEKRAKMAWQFRHEKRLQARAMMQSETEKELLRNRDIAKYGTPDGPTFEFLIISLESDGLKGNDVFEAVIKGSYRTDDGINKMLGF